MPTAVIDLSLYTECICIRCDQTNNRIQVAPLEDNELDDLKYEEKLNYLPIVAPRRSLLGAANEIAAVRGNLKLISTQ
jgi:hypothetical protein